MNYYTASFYNTHSSESKESAEQVIPLIMQSLAPKSVVDVGCGIGTWLSVFYEHGISEILGIDGDYVNRSQLLIPTEYFVARDLVRPLILPPDRWSSFDLAVSLEVAEHLSEAHATQFVSTLVSLAPVVLFSAAIPHQGGTDHVNEKWPNYWAALFRDRGYVTIDWLRPKVWGNTSVAYYYAQNSLLYISEDHVAQYPDLQDYAVAPENAMLSRVHPAKWIEANNLRSQPLKKVLAALPFSVVNAINRRVGRVVGK